MISQAPRYSEKAVSAPTDDHSSGIQVHDDTNKVLLFLEPVVGNITDPNLTWMFSSEITIYVRMPPIEITSTGQIEQRFR